MALKYVKDEEEETNVVTATARLCRTEDDRLVPESDPDARWLYCIPGQKIPRQEAERYGLLAKADTAEAEAVDAGEGSGQETGASEPKAAAKQARRPANKAAQPEGDK